ncbi:MAG: MoaD/ThiS family protein [Bryobacteraceae bacterium]|nr:MoaD/ThiS family protein [Bryobacteraceae bacterium]
MAVVFIPTLLRDLTGGRDAVEVQGANARQVIEELERACPGIRARLLDGERLRPNIRIAVDGRIAPLGLVERVSPASEVHFVVGIAGGLGPP